MIEVHSLHVALSFLGYLSLFTFYGLVIAKIWLAPAAAFELPDMFGRWRQMLTECLAVLAFSGVMLLLVRTAEMDDGTLFKVLADVPSVLAHTHFGHVWSLHLMTLLLLWACCAIFTTALPSSRWTASMVAGSLILAFTYSASSHASDNGDFTLAELNDWVHAVSTGVWGGSIFVSALLIFPLLKERRSMVSVAAVRLSSLAGVALVFTLATGIYNSSLQLPALDALFHTNYGRVLTGKLAVIGILILIGALNRLIIGSTFRKHASGNPHAVDQPMRVVFCALAVDAVFVLLALMMAAILVQNEPG